MTQASAEIISEFELANFGFKVPSLGVMIAFTITSPKNSGTLKLAYKGPAKIFS